ncbi:MAG: hypothetical protein JW730_07805 [Anaerolineales bacterium]|nr:hypothetical protein [Anaerolineales bacterium]
MKRRIFFVQMLFLVAGFLTSCTSNLSTLTTTNTVVPTGTNQHATSVAATPTEALPILPHTTVDPSTMTGKLMMGYQGWFACPGDGSNTYNGYYHWIKDGYPSLNTESYRVDMWPDTSELTDSEKCPTDLKYADGSPAYLYTSANYKTVLRHFQWMSEYGIDGVFIQRFGGQLVYPEALDFQNKLTDKVRTAADSYGRVWAVMYDVTGADARNGDVVKIFEKDWKYLVDVLRVTESPTYLHHNGLPVVAIWGLGFDDRPGTAAEAKQLLDFFQNNPDPKYRATVMGGVPIWWRTLQPNARTDPAWKDYYCSLDIISPWTVGVAVSDAEVDNYYKNTIIPDIAQAKECGAEFMPVVYPGSAYHNPDPNRPFNEYPRRGGRLYWRQIYNAISAGSTMIYNAMFDEVDEATAMYKIAATNADVPVGIQVVTMDTDGECLPSDWYLRLAGEATKMLRDEIPLSSTIPITIPEPSDPSACKQIIRIRLKITTTSDWTTITLSGIQFKNIQIESASPGAAETSADLNLNQLVLTQPLQQASAGQPVDMTADLFPTDLGPSTLVITIGRGNIGSTIVEVYTANGSDVTPVKTLEWSGITGGENLKSFEIPILLVDAEP